MSKRPVASLIALTVTARDAFLSVCQNLVLDIGMGTLAHRDTTREQPPILQSLALLIAEIDPELRKSAGMDKFSDSHHRPHLHLAMDGQIS
jgi:hypothetical protein